MGISFNGDYRSEDDSDKVSIENKRTMLSERFHILDYNFVGVILL